jgi:chemotaxis protein methyltransferase CheR
MRDSDCVGFLQWALPRMGLRWQGFRRVRRQVCRRVAARMQQLGVSGPGAYAEYLERNPTEWVALEALCGVTISRFHRDRGVFDCLAEHVLPELARTAGAGGAIDVWSAGCASGEEPYSLALIWEMRLAPAFGETALRVLATDRDPGLMARARRACYRRSSLRELPPDWVARAFERSGEDWCLSPAFKRTVTFELQDLRQTLPAGPFQLVLCRNLAFTYFDDRQQLRLLREVIARLKPDGYLVIGAHEQLPGGQRDLRRIAESPCIYRLAADGDALGH